jgi:hypothetical protein
MPYVVPCERCQHPVQPGRPGVWQHAEGWVEHRSAGGANALAMPVRHQRFLCASCMDLLRMGPAAEQTSLFD